MSRLRKYLAAMVISLGPLLNPQIAAAQEGPVGIGFAQAEEGTW